MVTYMGTRVWDTSGYVTDKDALYYCSVYCFNCFFLASASNLVVWIGLQFHQCCHYRAALELGGEQNIPYSSESEDS